MPRHISISKPAYMRSAMILINTTVVSSYRFIIIFLLIAACSGGGEDRKTILLIAGKADYLKGDYSMARLHFKQALRIDPTMTDAYYHLGLTEIQLGNVKQALGNFLRVTTSQPNHSNAQLQIGQIMLDAGFWQKAVQRANTILAFDSSHQTAMKLKATALLEGSNTEDKVKIAAQISEQLLQAGDLSADVYHQSATALLHQ